MSFLEMFFEFVSQSVALNFVINCNQVVCEQKEAGVCCNDEDDDGSGIDDDEALSDWNLRMLTIILTIFLMN
jgi:hypothetical protein